MMIGLKEETLVDSKQTREEQNDVDDDDGRDRMHDSLTRLE